MHSESFNKCLLNEGIKTNLKQVDNVFDSIYWLPVQCWVFYTHLESLKQPYEVLLASLPRLGNWGSDNLNVSKDPR